MIHRMIEIPDSAVHGMRQARRIAVLTGAGLGLASGLPISRDGIGGLWSRFDVRRLATEQAYRAQPDVVWGWAQWRGARAAAARPNTAHRAIAELADHVPEVVVITLNADGLHERAGSKHVLHLNGCWSRPFCAACGTAAPHEPVSSALWPAGGLPHMPPDCMVCGALLRPGKRWHEEPFDPETWQRALHVARVCDLMLCVGTSVETAGIRDLPYAAISAGTPVIQVNPNPTILGRLESVVRVETLAEIALPHLMAQAWPSGNAV